jgi:hypothetical protein
MTPNNRPFGLRIALCVLQWCLGVVILIEATLFLFGPGTQHAFATTHIANVFRLILGWGEIAGAVLLLIPKASSRGARLLLIIFVLAIALHLLHGQYNVGSLVVYSAAAWVLVQGKTPEGTKGRL